MIQDISPRVLHNEYVSIQPDARDRVFVFSENKVLIKEKDGWMRLPRKEDFLNEVHPYQYLFRIDEDRYFLDMDFALSEGTLDWKIRECKCRFEKMSDMRWLADRELCFASYTAYHLYQWYRGSQFCGRCGMRVKHDEKERMLYCDNCGSQSYPVIAPAVIVAVTNGDRILLTKYADRDYKRYALIAGFTEIGETAEETVRREVMEETGLRVKDIRYYKTQPWGIAGNLLIGYFAALDGDDTVHLDKRELAVAEWIAREDLKGMDDQFSLTREMIQVFYEKGS